MIRHFSAFSTCLLGFVATGLVACGDGEKAELPISAAGGTNGGESSTEQGGSTTTVQGGGGNTSTIPTAGGSTAGGTTGSGTETGGATSGGTSAGGTSAGGTGAGGSNVGGTGAGGTSSVVIVPCTATFVLPVDGTNLTDDDDVQRRFLPERFRLRRRCSDGCSRRRFGNSDPQWIDGRNDDRQIRSG
ncbi:MAG: hypothetical protein QM784_15055 [Polyangiaceae bacterium]